MQHTYVWPFQMITGGLEDKTIVWRFVESLEPAKVVHMCSQDVHKKENTYAQITVRFHSRQVRLNTLSNCKMKLFLANKAGFIFQLLSNKYNEMIGQVPLRYYNVGWTTLLSYIELTYLHCLRTLAICISCYLSNKHCVCIGSCISYELWSHYMSMCCLMHS